MSDNFDALIAQDEAARASVANDLSRTLFVEAGAGTGKTTALVGRIVNLVVSADEQSRRSLSQIAAITFTKAAAAELRERIRLKFESQLTQARRDGDQVMVSRCEQALADADIAAIQTLHGFAYRLLSEHPVEVGIPPRIELVDDVESQLAFEARWSAFLDTLYDDAELEEFIIRAAILGVDLAGKYMRTVAHAFDQNWDRLIGVESRGDRPMPLNFDGVREAVFAIQSLDLPDNPTDSLVKKIVSAQEVFQRFNDASSEHEKLRVVNEMAGLKFAGTGAKKNWGDDLDYARDVWSGLEDPILEILHAVANQTLTEITARIAVFTVESAQARRAEGVLEQQDLLVLALQLLKNSPEARASLSSRYSVLMLDEFQDTDPIQISLAMLLASSVTGADSGEWSDLESEPGRLFMVGDPKQSIYRFRRADIQLFLAAREKFADGSASLQRNFRTVEPVITAVNGLFSEVMAVGTELQPEYSPLIPTRTPCPQVDHRPLILGGGMPDNVPEIRAAEAVDVASVIAEIRDQPEKWLVGDGFDATGTPLWRKPKLSDVTVLLPKRISLKHLSAALDRRDIPFRANTGEPVYESQEIRDLLSVLRAIDDPSNELAMAAALRSPLYGCGYDDLYAFIAAGGKFSIDYAIPDSALGSPVAHGIEHLSALAQRKWWDEPSELLLRLIDERYAMVYPASERRARDVWRRLRYVVDQARKFSESGGGDLRAYLEWTDLQGSTGSSESEKVLPEADDDAVQVTTIHGSKGLEFPITIISGMDASLTDTRRGAQVLWGELGERPEIKIPSGGETKGFADLLGPEAENTEPEKERLLYVALTRARDHLVISGYHALKTNGDPKPSLGSKVHSWAIDGGKDLVRWLESEAAEDAGAGEPDGEATDRARSVDLAADEPADTSNVVSHAEWADAHSTRIANGSARSTISATGLAQAVAAGTSANEMPAPDVYGGTADDFDPIDQFDGEDGEMSGDELRPRVFKRGRAGTAIGTAVHGVLQFLDLANPSEDDIAALAESQAWSESVPEHLETIRESVRSALSADIVKACTQHRHYKELYVAAPVGSITVEGYVDLLVETPDGLVVVDYKTDSVNSEADVDKKLAHYALQGTAYALAIEAATGMSVVDVQFIFAKPGGPIVRSVVDLDAQRNAVLTAVGDLSE